MDSDFDQFKSPYTLPPIEQPKKKKNKKNKVGNEQIDTNISPIEQEEQEQEEKNEQNVLPELPMPISFEHLTKTTEKETTLDNRAQFSQPQFSNPVINNDSKISKSKKDKSKRALIIGLIITLVIILIVIIVIAIAIYFGTRDSNEKKTTTTGYLSTTGFLPVMTTSRSLAITSTMPEIKNYGRTCAYGKNYSFCDVCGLQPIQPNVKIVGGVNATKSSWPSIAFLVFDYTANYTSGGINKSRRIGIICGGTLIDRNTVLTAAHCYNDYLNITQDGVIIDLLSDPLFPSNAYKVYLGLHNKAGIFDGTADLTGVTVIPVKSFKIHESYNKNTYLNDIAIIKLTSNATLSSTVQPACLPLNADYKPTTDVPAWIAGWGDLSSGGISPDILQNVQITYYYFESYECRNYGSLNWNKRICAGESSGGKDTCQGDSGGPLYIKEGTTFIYIGITSSGYSCGTPGYPGLYTRVSAYLDWILLNI